VGQLHSEKQNEVANLYEGHLAVHRRIVALYPKVEAHAAYFRRPHRVSPRIPIPAGRVPAVDTDRVFCALALRAAATKDSILTLCEAGHGDSAIALTRVLLENATLMEWQRIGPGRERLETYILFTSVLRERTKANVRRFYAEFDWFDSGNSVSDPYHAAVAESVFQGYDDSWAYFPDPEKPSRLKRVSMRAMLEEIIDKKRPFEYEVMYRMGNDRIHTSPFGIANLLGAVTARTAFFLDVIQSRDPCVVALSVSNSLMLVVLQTVSHYVGLDLEPDIEDIHEATKVLAGRMPREELPNEEEV
jgi:hypothetical protein